MNFPLDSSTQTNTALTTTGTSYTYVNTNDLSTKQDLLNANTNLLGIGTNISALNYTNISVNKPTNFQSDWNSTIINKPTNFQSDWNSTIINKPDLTVYPLKTYVDGSLNTINSTLATKQNTITAVTPLKKDVSNNISIDLSGYTLLSSFNTLSSTVSTKENALTFTTPLTRTTNTIGIDLSAYPLKTYVDGSLNTINTALGTKQNTLTFSSPLVNTSNTVTIDLSAYPLKSYVDGSLNTINTNKQNKFTCITPLIKNDISNNISIDLSGYLLTSTATSTYATISNLNTKQNIISVTTPLIKNDVSNNISIDLSSYLLSSTASSTYATISNLNTKQNTLTFSSPLINTSNTITIDLSAYDTRSISESKYLKLSGGTMTGAIVNTSTTTSEFKAIQIGHPTRTTHIPYTPNNQIYFRAPVNIDNDADFLSFGARIGNFIIKLFGEDYGFGINSYTLRYSVPDAAAHRFYTGANNIFTISSSGVKFNNLVQNKVISLWDVASPNDFQFSGLGTNGGLTLNIPNNSTDSFIFKAGATATTTSELMRIQGSGNVGIGTNNPRSLLHIKGTNTALTIMAQGGSGATSQLNLSTYDHTTNLSPCSLIAIDNGTFGCTFAIKQKINGADANAQFTSLSISSSGDVGIGTATSASYKLSVGGAINATGSITTGANLNNYLSGLRINGGDTGNTIWQDSGDLGINANTGYSLKLGIGNGAEKMRVHTNGYIGINTANPLTHLQVNGLANITNGSPAGYTFMQSGSLIIGGTNANYGCQYYSGGAWSGTNTAGLLMECADNTEIVVHDANTRLVSMIAYYGGGSRVLYIGRAMGWDGGAATPVIIPGNLTINGSLNIAANTWVYDTDGRQRIFFGGAGRSYYQGYGQYTTDIQHEWRNHVGTGVMFLGYTGSLLLSGEIIPTMTSIGTNGTDCCGVSFNSSQGTTYQTSIKIIYGTFTGFHRCFTDDIEFKEEEPQKFKDDYVGRIVISSGKIATDSKTENDTEWNILYDKEGITIEDALPIIQLSRKKKDKKVFGVLGMPTRQNSRNERLIVNSVGEGAIWVCNSNGNIENGDYITSSDHLGYGEKQDDDLLHNYTVAKATIDCNFELESPFYNCLELDNGLRIAFIACTYHCG